ncbi:MAG: hypothetical protein L7H18_00135 [Candidatus Nealsonbacteria bacterium DGGOD1a]|nr:MAG: hypothetical protein L7H18_00135 [Candidatus Nealsonbacteria bacterium DGGOD1a]
MSSETIKNKITGFVKYHNSFVIGLVLALLGGAAIFAADPEAKKAVLGEEIITQSGVDNIALLAADLGSFDFAMKIGDVFEDDKKYYVDYSFETIGIQDNIWQTITRHSSMEIDKLSLAGGDLGLYVQEQLTQVAQNELAYLERVQLAEKEKGQTEIAKTVEYTGLIGLVLDVRNAVLPGYDPVVKPAPVELAQDAETPEEIMDEPAENGGENDNSSLITGSNNQPSGTGGNPPAAGSGSGAGGSADNQPPSGNGTTTTEEAVVPPPEPSEPLEPSQTSETSNPSETLEPSQPSEPSEPSESEPVVPEPDLEPDPEQ